MKDHVKLNEIAKRLQIDRSTVLRLIKRTAEELGLKPIKGKQNIIYLKKYDAERLIAYYESHLNRNADESDQSYQRFGFFYIIQIVPEAIPNRVKIGYTDNLEQRLAEHRTVAPTAKLLKSWRCKRSWDYAAMDSITRKDCVLVLNEVYEGEIQGFLDRAEEFFALMPDSSEKTKLSTHSPLLKNNNDT